MISRKLNKKWTTIAKYLFAVLATGLAYQTSNNIGYLVVGILELIVIAICSDMLLKKYKRIGYWGNSIALLLYTVQMFVVFFGNSFIQMVMLTNLDSIELLKEHFLEYGIAIFFVLGICFLPTTEVNFTGKSNFLISVVSVCLIILLEVVIFRGSYSPFVGYVSLVTQNIQTLQQDDIQVSVSDTKKMFYKESLVDCRIKDNQLPEKPNIILIFMEGLSSHIVTDERNIMPNVARLQENSLRFTEYYNHTFATYRGLIGQLYSGYQYENLDENKLIGIQDILSDNGYETTFINVEPRNDEFSNYLESFAFNQVIGTADMPHNGLNDTMSDYEGYALLKEEMVKNRIRGGRSTILCNVYSGYSCRI